MNPTSHAAMSGGSAVTGQKTWSGAGRSPALNRATTRSTFFAPHSSWGLGLDGQGVADPERTDMNSAGGSHLKKRRIRRLEPFKVTRGDLAASSKFDDVTKQVAGRARVVAGGSARIDFYDAIGSRNHPRTGDVYRAGSIHRRTRFGARSGGAGKLYYC